MKDGETIRAIREQLQVISHAEETSGRTIQAAIKKVDRLLENLEAKRKANGREDA